MKSKKLPIFLEITRKSFFVIVLILVIYAITQLMKMLIMIFHKKDFMNI